MENKNISQIVMDRIKEDKIVPISKNVFSIKRVLFWTIVASSFIVGAVTFTLIISSLFDNDWDLYNKYGFNFILKTLPYFWLVSLIVFTMLGEFYYRKTLLGHRQRFVFIIAIYMFSTIFFGFIFYLLNFGDSIEELLEKNAPTYSYITMNRHQFWYHPEDGLLSGRIIQVNENEIQVLDINNIVWIINTDNSVIRGNKDMIEGSRIKIIGNIVNDNNFKAYEVRPWRGMR